MLKFACSWIRAALLMLQLLTAVQMTVELPPAFHVFYATGWEDPVLRVRELTSDSTPIHEVPCCLLSK